MSQAPKEVHRSIARRIRGSAGPFVALLAILLLLAGVIFAPLWRPLAWSALLSFFAAPLFHYMKGHWFGGRRENICAGITTAIILLFWILPMVVLGFVLTRETANLFSILSGWLPSLGDSPREAARNYPFVKFLLKQFPILTETMILEEIFRNMNQWLVEVVKTISREAVGNAAKMVYSLMVIIVGSFFMVRDGHILRDYVRDLLPLPPEQRELLIRRAETMLRSVVYGIIFTAGIQAFLGGLGCWVAGVPSPALFGSFMFFTAMIPFVGTPIVWIPCSIYLLAQGRHWAALFLFLWGLCVVGTIDNFIRPIFISEGSKLHVLIVFTGVLGGLFAWGFLGLFLGPLVLSLCIFMLDCYREVVRERIDSNFEQEE